MNAIAKKYLNSQIGKIQERIKLAKLAGKPIVFLQTSEMEILKELLTSGAIFPNMPTRVLSNHVLEKSSVLFKLPDFILENDGISRSVISKPTLFVLFADETDAAQQQNSETILLNKALHAFIQLYKEVFQRPDKNATTASRAILNSMIFVVTAEIPKIPANIHLYTEYVKPDPIQDDELNEFISHTLHKLDPDIELMKSADGNEYLKDAQYLSILSKNLKGLSKAKIEQIFRKIDIVLGGVNFKISDGEYESIPCEILKVIRAEKEQLIATSSILKLQKELGDKKATGLDNLEEYLKEKREIVKDFAKYKQERMLEPPKGILVSGIPGSGKSLMARYAASLLDIPLIRMDMGDVQNMYVGESERRMVEALDLVNAMSPCILWVDEIEKSLAGSSGHTSNDVTKRLFGKFLTWMQEKEDKDVCCFVFATANDIRTLPPELFRSGRFDAKFYTYMPSAEECGEIFEALITKQCSVYKKEHATVDKELFATGPDGIGKNLFIDYLNSPLCLQTESDAERTNRKNKFFSGADIENVIKRAKEIYLLKNYSIAGTFVYQTNDFLTCLEQSIAEIRTYGETDLEKIAACFAAMASNNFSPASKGVKDKTHNAFFDLMPFEGYDEHRQETLYMLENEEKHLGRMRHEYDRRLYCIIRDVLNRDREEIINNRKQ